MKNPEIKKKVQQEIDANFKVSDDPNDIYESVANLKYLDRCVLETLRKYPPLPVLSRICGEDYQIENSSMVIKKGTAVIIPIFALQRDENIYEDPLKFDPDRFLKNSNGSDYEGSYYLPAGEGIRGCLGQRMGRV